MINKERKSRNGKRKKGTWTEIRSREERERGR